MASAGSGVVLALVLIVGACREGVAQSAWQPAAGHTQIPLWPSGVPGAAGVGRTSGPEAVHFAVDPKGNKRLVGGRPRSYIENVTIPTMTVYAPKGNNSGAAVLVFPGGGYYVLAIDIEGTEACDWVTSNGMTCVLLKYRVPCAHVGRWRDCPPAHQDAQRAMRMVRSRAAEWGINPNRIGVMGFSAGGHMVTVISTHFEKRPYQAVDAADSASARPDFAFVLYAGHVVGGRDNLAPNPDLPVTSRTPPTFVLHSYADPLNPVENALVYVTALRKAGVPAEMHLFAKGGHAIGLRRTAEPITGWPDLAKAWLTTIGMIGGKR